MLDAGPGLRAPGAPQSQDSQETDQVDFSDPVSVSNHCRVSSFTNTEVDYICWEC